MCIADSPGIPRRFDLTRRTIREPRHRYADISFVRSFVLSYSGNGGSKCGRVLSCDICYGPLVFTKVVKGEFTLFDGPYSCPIILLSLLQSAAFIKNGRARVLNT